MLKLPTVVLVAVPLLLPCGCGRKKGVGAESHKPPWEWSDREATLAYSLGRQLDDYQVEVIQGKGGIMASDNPLTIRISDAGKLVYRWKGHWGTVFTRREDTLYIADYCPLQTGCTVFAVDFKRNKELWRSKLKGLGPVAHSKYSNSVCIGNDGDTILVYGQEAGGSYREKLDRRTGKTVSNEVLRGR